MPPRCDISVVSLGAVVALCVFTFAFSFVFVFAFALVLESCGAAGDVTVAVLGIGCEVFTGMGDTSVDSSEEGSATSLASVCGSGLLQATD